MNNLFLLTLAVGFGRLLLFAIAPGIVIQTMGDTAEITAILTRLREGDKGNHRVPLGGAGETSRPTNLHEFILMKWCEVQVSD